jgi:hypothetical protein
VDLVAIRSYLFATILKNKSESARFSDPRNLAHLNPIFRLEIR